MNKDIHIHTLLDDAVTLLREMVAIPSPSFQEEMVSLHVSDFLTHADIRHIRLRNNIISINSGYIPDRKTLMLCAHLDTVMPASDYSSDPYNPDAPGTVIEHGPSVYGLGSNDDGASAVSMIAAHRYFYDKPLPVNLMLVLSTEEERSGKGGMKAVWDALADGLPYEDGTVLRPPQWAAIGEPTGMKAAVAERGLLVLDGLAEGESGHAARNEGDNALYTALDDINRMRNFRFGRVSPLMGEVHLNITQIQAGTAHNVIPDRCSFVVDIRPNGEYSNKDILKILQGICKSRLVPRNMDNRASSTRSGSPLLQCTSAIGMETFVSPTTSDWIRIGCDAIKAGPGESARSHRKDEYVTIAEIEDGIRTYIRFISSLADIITTLEK